MERDCSASLVHKAATFAAWSLVSFFPYSQARAEVFDIPPGDVSALIAAINLANATAEYDTIRLQPGMYTLTLIEHADTQGNGNGLPLVTSAVTVAGAGPEATIINRELSSPDFRLFHVAPSGDLTIDGVTLSGGMAQNGGGIRNEGIVRLHHVTLTRNEALDQDPVQDATGGALYNGGMAEISDSLLTDNIADSGGAIANTGQLHLTDVSILDNSTTNDTFASGAGIACLGGDMELAGVTIANNVAPFGLGGAIRNDCEATLRNVTISGNTARRWGAIWGRNLAEMSITNSTITGNSATSVQPPVANIVGGVIIFTNSIVGPSALAGNCYENILFLSGGHNIDADGSCHLRRAGDMAGLDPSLGPLEDNGGPTLTHALLPGSPAIDAADDAKCPSIDQRGIERPQDGDGNGVATCDIGAFELESQNKPPVAEAGIDRVVECTGLAGAAVNLDGSASSDPDSTPGTNDDIKKFEWFENFGGPYQRLLGSGQRLTVTLTLGLHVVTLQVTDSQGASATARVTVTVVDTTPPALVCPIAASAECSMPGGALVGLTSTAADACSPTVTLTNTRTGSGADASGFYPLGMTGVTFMATDASGNTVTCTSSVQVRDTIPPSLTLTLSPTTLWPPNHRMVPVQAALQVSDVCDSSPNAVLASATSSEPDDAPGSGDGNTTGDIQDASVSTPDTAVLLRAERSGDGPGRVYTLTYAARDASGNMASALGIVTVPHDLGAGPEPVSLGLEGDGTTGMAHLYWNAVTGAEMYDLIEGDLSQVTTQNGILWLGPVHVQASAQSQTSYSEGSSGTIPPVGGAFFYLVQYRDGLAASGWGTESSPWPAEPTSCDSGCPGELIQPSIASSEPLRK